MVDPNRQMRGKPSHPHSEKKKGWGWVAGSQPKNISAFSLVSKYGGDPGLPGPSPGSATDNNNSNNKTNY